MSVLKAFFKITRSNLKILLIYCACSMVMSIVFASSEDSRVEVFTQEKVKVAVIDEDNTESSEALKDYLEDTQELVNVGDTDDKIQDDLYFGRVKYLVRIPEGFEKSLTKDDDYTLKTTCAPGSYNGVFLDMSIEEFVTKYKSFLALGLDRKDAIEKTRQNLSLNADVETYIPENKSKDVPKFYTFFLFMGYGFIAILCHALGSVMVSFNAEDMRKRMNCSALSVKMRNFYMVLGCLVITTVVWAIYQVVALAFAHESMFATETTPFIIANSFILAIMAMSVGFLAGTIAKHDGHVAICSVSASMVFSFLGGVFVSLDYLSPSVLRISRFVPTYWYVSVLDKLTMATKMDSELTKVFFNGIGIQLVFAITFAAIAFLVSRSKAAGKSE